MIEVCLCISTRIERLASIINNLKEQTNQNFHINIWNNSSLPIHHIDFPEHRTKIIHSEENLGSKARFYLAKMTKSNPIIFIDDDLILTQDFIDFFYRQYLKFGKNCILGNHVRIFNNEHYWKSMLVDTAITHNIEVDYVGTGGMILDRWIIDHEDSLQNIPEPLNRVEDLYLSYIARMKYNMTLLGIESKYEILYDGKDQFNQLYNYKQNAFQTLRNSGWKLLKDRRISTEPSK